MTAPDTRDSVELIVAEMRGRADCLPDGCDWAGVVEQELRDWMVRLSARPQQAGGEDGLGFVIEEREAAVVLDWSKAGGHGCRPASPEECAMWDRIAALQAEVGNWRKDCEQMRAAANWWGNRTVEERARAETAEVALREAQANDRRYRWLRDDPPVTLCVRVRHDTKRDLSYQYLDGPQLDAAIDAAIGGTGDA